MRVAARLVLCVLAGFATALPAQKPGEWLYQAPLPELDIGFQRERDGSSIVERIPPGETVENWTRMVTTQRFAGVISRGGSVDEWLGHFVTSLSNGCPGARSSRPNFARQPGRVEVSLRIDCPLNPTTGRPETLFLRAFGAATDLHVLQVAYRHAPTGAEAEWAERYLAMAALCDGASTNPVCRSGPAAGR